MPDLQFDSQEANCKSMFPAPSFPASILCVRDLLLLPHPPPPLNPMLFLSSSLGMLYPLSYLKFNEKKSSPPFYSTPRHDRQQWETRG